MRPNAVHRVFVPVCIVSPVVDVQVKCNVQIEYMCNNCACALLLNRPSTRPDGPGRSDLVRGGGDSVGERDSRWQG